MRTKLMMVMAGVCAAAMVLGAAAWQPRSGGGGGGGGGQGDGRGGGGGGAGAPAAPAVAVPLVVAGYAGSGMKTVSLSGDELKGMTRTTVKSKDHDGGEHTYVGVPVIDLLKRAEMKFGQSLRGAKLRDYLLAEDNAGYGVVIALTEVDPEFSGRVVIVADTMDGAAFSGRDGPLRLVISDEVKHARWVRNLSKLTVCGPPPTPPAAATTPGKDAPALKESIMRQHVSGPFEVAM